VDGRHFDALARQLSSRRTALGGLLAGLLLPLEAAARKKGKDKQRQGKGKDRHKGKAKQRASAQLEPCWRAGACIVSKGSNVSQCDLEGYIAPDPLDCTRCNLSRANLRGADLTGVNFTRANLSGACLVDANFFGATFTNSTNLYNAIFCRTIMPDGSVNNSGCGSATACCPTCNRWIGMTCGTPGNLCCDGSACQNGTCVCVPATCQSLGKTCGTWPDGCGGMLSCGTCSAGCICSDLSGGSGTVCRQMVLPTCTPSCDQCPAGMVCIVASHCSLGIGCSQACT
jgi:hypothetical protein